MQRMFSNGMVMCCRNWDKEMGMLLVQIGEVMAVITDID